MVKSLSSEISQATAFIHAVEKQNWDYSIDQQFRNSKLFNVLIKFRESLKEIAEKEKQHKWITDGIVQFAELIKKNPEHTAQLCDIIIKNLVKYLQASHGSIFLHNKNKETLEGAAFFAYDKKKFIEASVNEGEGLIGQCFLEGDIIYITQVPQDYIKITSGLGQALPRAVILIPIQLSGQKLGVIELASFNSFETHHIEFLRKLSENIASVLTNVQNSERNNQLLKQAEDSAKELREKEEQLMQSIEELQCIQEEMQRQNKELDSAKRIIEEKNTVMEAMQRQEMELIESKLRAQDEIHQTIVRRLQFKVHELQLQRSQQPVTI